MGQRCCVLRAVRDPGHTICSSGCARTWASACAATAHAAQAMPAWCVLCLRRTHPPTCTPAQHLLLAAPRPQVYDFNVPTFGKGVVYDVDQKARVISLCTCRNLSMCYILR